MTCYCGHLNRLRHKDCRCPICYTIVRHKRPRLSEGISELIRIYREPISVLPDRLILTLVKHHVDLVLGVK